MKLYVDKAKPKRRVCNRNNSDKNTNKMYCLIFNKGKLSFELKNHHLWKKLNSNLGNSNTERMCSLVVIVVCGECGDDGVVVRFFKAGSEAEQKEKSTERERDTGMNRTLPKQRTEMDTS